LAPLSLRWPISLRAWPPLPPSPSLLRILQALHL
jgi:hypothetical protein